MAHEQMFDDDDPILARVREIALALPGAKEKVSVGHPAFYTSKVFAWYGMSHKPKDEWVREAQSVAVLLPEGEREAVAGMPQAYIPGYIGVHGWVSLRLSEQTDWQEIAELLEESYRNTAGKRLIQRLDAR